MPLASSFAIPAAQPADFLIAIHASINVVKLTEEDRVLIDFRKFSLTTVALRVAGHVGAEMYITSA